MSLNNRYALIWAVVAVVVVALGIALFIGFRGEDRKASEQDRILMESCSRDARAQIDRSVTSVREVTVKNSVVTGEVALGAEEWLPFTCEQQGVAVIDR
ncbi:hypothetical protein HQO24_10495 [Rhodococcus fascians]|nr:hypothetical protein [Rhodococcus fascians]MBY4396890.1 hypothetical protein [Rhodococcus fascians]MBY4407369.1 hypothetical protein [Rhodococcus fascians]MBY4421502.1 hypothetical protein [Rhodococcus fascians]MBY4460745.1 hypothetical protein [Rhodococcus fascians]